MLVFTIDSPPDSSWPFTGHRTSRIRPTAIKALLRKSSSDRDGSQPTTDCDSVEALAYDGGTVVAITPGVGWQSL